ncbi:MAG: phosphate ABC transporter ATP-binding protein [Bacteroidetes bacterium]|nr:phosphate ABC transporter ATP-binding protein [Fibrella sp.]
MAILESKSVNVFYGTKQVIDQVSMGIDERSITALIGPSGCGKSTFLRLFNRMNDFISDFRKEGDVLAEGKEIYAPDVSTEDLRKRVGMVFQQPNPFPKSIFENVVYGLRLQGVSQKSVLNETAEHALRRAALWNEVNGMLGKSALSLSGGQQQRLCIARALAVQPVILLLDEPASSLDPISTAKIEELLLDLKQTCTLVIVTHNMQQASRISDKTAFFSLGKLIEYDATKRLFSQPREGETQRYLAGKFG